MIPPRFASKTVVLLAVLAAELLTGCGSSSTVVINPVSGHRIVSPSGCITLPGPHKTLCGGAATAFCKSAVGMYSVTVGIGASLGKPQAVADAETLRKLCEGVGVDLAGHRLSKSEETSPAEVAKLERKKEAQEQERTLEEHRAEPPAQKTAEAERYAEEAYKRLKAGGIK